MTAEEIFQAVLDAMQPAEELGGPEGQDYLDLMSRIAAEASQRAQNCREVMKENDDDAVGRGL